MPEIALIVSNPPHATIDIDVAAAQLGLTVEQMRGKANYPVPEIWSVAQDRLKSEDVAGALRMAGCKVVALGARELRDVPRKHRVKSFSFSEDGFVAHLDDMDVTIGYDQPMIAVFCRPREQVDPGAAVRPRRTSGFMSIRDSLTETRTSGPTALTDDDAGTPFFDLYVSENGAAARITVVQNAVSFSGLGRVQPRAASNMAALVESCEDRFRRAFVDRRLEGMRLRRQTPGRRPEASEHRKGYSFASPRLLDLLPEISQDLETISQPEMAARLAFLTDRATR